MPRILKKLFILTCLSLILFLFLTPTLAQDSPKNEIEHLERVLKQKDIDIKLKDWAIRNLKKYPASISGPILLEQLDQETSLELLPVMAYILGELKYLEAVPQLVRLLNTSLTDYGFKSPQECSDYIEELQETRRDLYKEQSQLKELVKLRRQHQSLQRQIQSFKKQTDNLKAKGRQPNQSHKDYQKQLKALQKQYQNLQKQADDIDKQIKDLESATEDVRNKLTETDQEIKQTQVDIAESSKQKTNLDLVYLRSIEALGKMRTIDEAAINRLYNLIFTDNIPVAFMAIDALKLINDSQIITLLAREKLSDPTHTAFKRASLALTELSAPYHDPADRSGSEWIAKSVLTLLSQKLAKQPNNNSAITMKMLQIIKHLQRPEIVIDDPKQELNWSIEFINVVNSIIQKETYFEYTLLVRFIKDDIVTRALNRTFHDVLKPTSPTKTNSPK